MVTLVARNVSWGPVIGVAAFTALFSFSGCAPKPSSVPLGVGPLALAEREGAPAPTRTTKATNGTAAKATARAEPPALEDTKEEPEDEADDGENSTAEGLEVAAGGAGGSAASAAAPSFAGFYAGEDVAIFRLPGFPEREQRDDKAKIRIEAASGGNVSIVLVNSENGSDLCEITARVDGNSALIESPQPCFTAEGEGGMQADLSSGRAVLDGDRLTMDAEGTLLVTVGDQDLEGELSYSFEGSRQSP